MEAARATWTDSRLDDLKETVVGIDRKVTRLDQKVDERYALLDSKVDAGLGRIDDRIDALHHSLVYGMIALISIIAVLLTAFLSVVVTRL